VWPLGAQRNAAKISMRPMFLPSRLQDRLLRLLPQDLQTGHFQSASSAFAGMPPRLEGQSANRVHVYHRTTEILSGGAGEQGLRPPSSSARRESITPNLHPSEVGSQIRTDHEVCSTISSFANADRSSLILASSHWPSGSSTRTLYLHIAGSV
jgi:hypothetical protein